MNEEVKRESRMRDILIDKLRNTLKASSVFTLGAEEMNLLKN